MECPDIRQISCAAFVEAVNRRAPGRRIPWAASLELTARCNLRCVHCYINLPADDRSAQEKELKTTEIRHLIDCMVEEGTLWLLLTGGEPLLRPDFEELYTYAKTSGLLVTLFTNGTALTPRSADLLADYPPESVEITIYGASEETYERVTRVPGSYSRCVRGIELLRTRLIAFKLKTMALSLNKHELSEMKAFAANLGVDFRFDPALNLRLDGASSPAKFRIAPEEVVALDLADERRMKGWRELIDRFGGLTADPVRLYDCGAGLDSFHVDPYGMMSACMMARTPGYDLRSRHFSEAWHELLPQVREQTRSKPSRCSTCGLTPLCGQCPGWGQLEHGDPEETVEYLCAIAHLRARAFGLPDHATGERR